MILIASGLMLLSLLSTPDLGFTIKENPVPCAGALASQELFNALPSLTGCLKPLHDTCADKQAREISAGDRTLRLDTENIIEGRGKAYERYTVISDGEDIYDFREDVGPSSVWGFFNHGEDWVLETRTRVVVNGADVASARDLDSAAHYRFLGDRPLFLAQKGDRHFLMTDQGPLAEYDRVLCHLCCEATVLNPGCENGVYSFYAIRGDDVLLVEVTPSE